MRQNDDISKNRRYELNITFNKGKPYEEVFTTEQIESMTKDQLKGLKQRCTECIAEIANKRSHYKNENTEETNSDEFWTKMNKYKAAITQDLWKLQPFRVGSPSEL